MIIPIGHEEDSVRRLPWVTFGVMIACFAAFALSGELGDTASRDEDAAERALPAIQYYLEHPYLELHPDLEGLVFEGLGDDERRALFEVFRGEFPTPDDPETLRQQQQELDRLTVAALEGIADHPYFRWGLVPARPTPVTFATHMFLHGGLLHLLGNLLILYLAGPFIEDVWGRPLYAGFYLASGVAAALTFIAFNSDSTIPMIGASGAIAGVMGAFLVRYRGTRIKFFYWFGLVFRGTFMAPAWLMLPLWFAEQLFMASMGSGATGVAYWAHIGGFVFGVGAALAIAHWKLEERIAPSLEQKLTAEVLRNPRVEEALQAEALGNVDHALALLGEETSRNPSDVDAALALWGVAVEHQRAAEAADVMLGAVRQELRRGHAELALTHWAELVERVPAVRADPDLLIRLAGQLEAHDRAEEGAALLRRAMLAAGAEMPTETALRIARLAARLDPRVARGAARLALARGDLPDAERLQAERLLAS